MKTERTCEICKNRLPDRALFCRRCGAPVEPEPDRFRALPFVLGTGALLASGFFTGMVLPTGSAAFTLALAGLFVAALALALLASAPPEVPGSAPRSVRLRNALEHLKFHPAFLPGPGIRRPAFSRIAGTRRREFPASRTRFACPSR
jgi:hypothetical protein